jgi:acetate kinase
MRILALNAGSSSLKFQIVDVREGGRDLDQLRVQTLFGGAVEHVGQAATIHITQRGQVTQGGPKSLADHAAAVRWTFEHLDCSGIEAVGHRVVHGGSRFHSPVRIDAEVLAEIDRLSELAPLHNPASLDGIRGAREVLGSSVPMVAVFDTAFFHDLPPVAAAYAISQELASKHAIRRYGFHGIAHASLAAGYAAAAGRQLDRVRLITLHLGNGCSAAAIRHGRPVDTSMGFTPLEGLVMGTRSGDLDPAVVSYLVRRAGMSVETVERWLNERSGLLGVSGRTHDMGQLLRLAGEDSRASLAVELFCYRVRKYIGAYLAALGGADAIVFGGGIGERSPEIRARICEGMEYCGLRLDHVSNSAAAGLHPGNAARISRGDAALAAYVVAVDEETWIAEETTRCLGAARS